VEEQIEELEPDVARLKVVEQKLRLESEAMQKLVDGAHSDCFYKVTGL